MVAGIGDYCEVSVSHFRGRYSNTDSSVFYNIELDYFRDDAQLKSDAEDIVSNRDNIDSIHHNSTLHGNFKKNSIKCYIVKHITLDSCCCIGNNL